MPRSTIERGTMTTSNDFELVERTECASEWRHRGNGLTALVWPTPVAPVVGFGVVYRVGSRHEVTGHTGATHILEHLMFKGSKKFNQQLGTEVSRQLHRIGAQFNATTWLDRTNYYEVLPAEHLPLAVDIESDRMRNALVQEEALASERTVVLNELEMGENDPFDLLMKGSFAHAYLEHPYHHPTIGWKGDVETVTAEVLRRFYDTFYHPDNATVLVVGDVEEASALTEVARGFGRLPRAPRPFPEVRIRESEQRGERRFEVRRAGELGQLMLTWHIPEGLHPDIPALAVLTTMLSDGVTSRLYRRLVEPNRCLGVQAFTMDLHDPGVLQVVASLAPGVEHEEVEDAIRAEIRDLRTAKPDEHEMRRALAQIRTDLAFHRESPGQIMSALTESIAMGDWRRFPRELDAISKVGAEDVQRVAAQYLTSQGLTVGSFVPETSVGNGAGGRVSPGPRPCYLRAPFADRVVERKLPHGGRAAVLANPYAPTVTVAGTIRAGTACATDGRFSVPSLCAAMLNRGTESFGRMELARELEDHGLQLGVRASASSPSTVAFSAQGLADQLPRIATLLAEVLWRPTFPPEELEKLRQRVLGSLVREREETQAIAYGALSRHLYPKGHPQRKRRIEVREREVQALVRDDLVEFHRSAYGQASLALAVVGDVKADEVADIFKTAFRGGAGGVVDTVVPANDGIEKPADERIEVPDRPNLDVFLGHRSSVTRAEADYGAAMIANACLGQSTLTSRLGVAVRDQAGLTYGIYSRFFGTLLLPGPWAVSLSVSADNLDRAISMCREIIADYVAHGPTEIELNDERSSQAGAYRVGLATNGGVARELVSVLTSGQPIEHLDRYPRQVLALSRAEVTAAIARHLHPDRLVVTAAGTMKR